MNTIDTVRQLDKYVKQTFLHMYLKNYGTQFSNKAGLDAIEIYYNTGNITNLSGMLKCAITLYISSSTFIESESSKINEDFKVNKDFIQKLKEERLINEISAKIFKELKIQIITPSMAIEVLEVFNSVLDDMHTPDFDEEYKDLDQSSKNIFDVLNKYIKLQIETMRLKIEYLKASIESDKSICDILQITN